MISWAINLKTEFNWKHWRKTLNITVGLSFVVYGFKGILRILFHQNYLPMGYYAEYSYFLIHLLCIIHPFLLFPFHLCIHQNLIHAFPMLMQDVTPQRPKQHLTLHGVRNLQTISEQRPLWTPKYLHHLSIPLPRLVTPFYWPVRYDEEGTKL